MNGVAVGGNLGFLCPPCGVLVDAAAAEADADVAVDDAGDDEGILFSAIFLVFFLYIRKFQQTFPPAKMTGIRVRPFSFSQSEYQTLCNFPTAIITVKETILTLYQHYYRLYVCLA